MEKLKDYLKGRKASDLTLEEFAQYATVFLEVCLHDHDRLPPWVTIFDVTDRDGNAPNASNNYLVAEDGKSIAGIFSFTSQPPAREIKTKKGIPFKFYELSNGRWARTHIVIQQVLQAHL